MPRRHPKPLRPPPPRPDPARAAQYEARRRAVCARKDRYASEAEARAFALAHTPGRGPRATAYRCDVCAGWHLTSGRGRAA